MSKESALLTTSEVAVLFRVHPKTVTRWAEAGRLNHVRTLGGHRRFQREEIENLLANAYTIVNPEPVAEEITA